MAVDATTAAATANSATSGARSRLATNFDTFLTLLTTQLKNQDPLSPMDSTQFTQQLTQMTGVEQQLLTNDLLTKLVSNTGSGVSTAVSLIGKEVRADSNVAALKGGKAEWSYSLARDASDVKLEIVDSKGRTVRTIAGTDNKAGEHKLVWDGKATGGGDLEDGVYTLKITAKDTQGSAVTSSTYIDGKVTGVEQSDGTTYLTINGAKVLWDRLVSIRQPEETQEASKATGSGSTSNSTDDKTSSPAAA
jgi:flagellar basal-body rod modification protein FlgD